jgi:hypothetical protein
VIIIRQPPPTITVEIPHPEIIVQMPDPQVQIQVPEPTVSVAPDEGPAEGAPVNVQQLQPEVRFESLGDPVIVIVEPEGSPTVTFEPLTAPPAAPDTPEVPEGAAPTGAPPEGALPDLGAPPEATPPDVGAPPTGDAAAGAAAEGATATAVATVSALTDMAVFTAAGTIIGEVSGVAVENGQVFIDTTLDGAVAADRRDVAVPGVSLRLAEDNRLVLVGMTPDEVAAMPAWQATDSTEVPPDDREVSLAIWQQGAVGAPAQP